LPEILLLLRCGTNLRETEAHQQMGFVRSAIAPLRVFQRLWIYDLYIEASGRFQQIVVERELQFDGTDGPVRYGLPVDINLRLANKIESLQRQCSRRAPFRNHCRKN